MFPIEIGKKINVSPENYFQCYDFLHLSFGDAHIPQNWKINKNCKFLSHKH
jgi:hypothetical protein